METQLDLSRKYGIVLEGGGAKGSYQIGVWKALREEGLQIEAISGASVGALNGALICMNNLEKAEEIWSHIGYSDVMNVDDGMMKALRNKDFASLDFQELAEMGKQVIRERGFDIAPLRNMLSVLVDEERIRNSPIELFITTFSFTEHRELVVHLNEEEKGTMADMLLASAYFPAFKNEKLQGKRFIDGGGLNNVPLDVLLERGYRDIIVIRIYGLGLDKEKVIDIPEDAHVYHIAPLQDLGGILEFDSDQAKKNMLLGYYDGKRFLYGLSGRAYYIDAPGDEAYYFNKLLSLDNLLGIYGKKKAETGYRWYTEKLFPSMAKKFKLKKDWNYKSLYIGMIEDYARTLKIERFNIYRETALLQQIQSELCETS